MGDTDVNQVFTSEAEWRESLLSRELLSAAAVLGPEFALAILARVFGLAGRELFDAIDEAEQAGLLEKDPDH
jgi:predicted ATPase